MAAKRKPISRNVALAELQRRADSYAQSLRDKMFANPARPSLAFMEAIDSLIAEFAKLRIAFSAHLNGEK